MKDGKKTEVHVGYTQAYAVPVHENTQAFHNVGQAKYLEQPAREHQKDVLNDVEQAYKRGASLGDSMVVGGLRLQRESQKLVPVDTGALKNSAFTRKKTS